MIELLLFLLVAQEPLAKKQKSALDDAEKCVSALSKDVVIESGPVDYATEYQEIEEEDEYDDADLSTAQILAHQQEDFEGVYSCKCV